MSSFKNFTFAFALAIGATAAGCAATTPGGGGDGSGGGGDGSGSGSSSKPLDPTGKYQLQSTFDISTNIPGTVGTVINDFIGATNGPNQPTQWILDQIIAQMGSGTLKTLLQSAEPFVAGYLNDQLLSIAPDFVSTILLVGNDFGDIAKHFGINSTLDVAGSGTFTAVHTATGVHFKIDTTDMDFAFADYQVPNVVVNGVGITLDATAKLTVADHKLPLSYGKILRIGLDAAIIPLVDSNATNLQTLFADKIDCAAVGSAINDALSSQFGFGGGAGTWQTACNAGLQFGANAIYQKISAIDASALEFDLNGTAKAVDTNHDYKVDALQTGKWLGTLSYSGTPAPLSTATFTGARM
jgi:hypothetical protein